MFTINFYYAKDLVKDVLGSKKVVHNFIASLIGCVGIVLVCYLCAWSWNSLIWRTILSVILSVTIYIAILVLLRNEIAIAYINKIQTIIKSRL